MVKVKICGITNLADALAAISYGADALGFLVGQVHPSLSRFITPEEAARIVSQLPPFCSTVLVTHLALAHEILPVAKIATVTTIQFHGTTSSEEANKVRNELAWAKTY